MELQLSRPHHNRLLWYCLIGLGGLSSLTAILHYILGKKRSTRREARDSTNGNNKEKKQEPSTPSTTSAPLLQPPSFVKQKPQRPSFASSPQQTGKENENEAITNEEVEDEEARLLSQLQIQVQNLLVHLKNHQLEEIPNEIGIFCYPNKQFLLFQ